MALFTDGNISTIEDLKAAETEILEVSGTEGIDLSAKLEAAAAEIASDLTAFLLGEQEACAMDLKGVVVTPLLAQWHVRRTVANVYRDAYHHQLNDRHKGKWQLYEELAGSAGFKLRQVGVGIVTSPIPRAPKPEGGGAPGSGPPGTYYVQVAWTGAGNIEGAASDALVVDVPLGNTLIVRGGEAPSGVEAWNVYVGTSEGACMRQNADPLPAGATWMLPPSGIQAGASAGEGQGPDYYVRASGRLLRG